MPEAMSARRSPFPVPSRQARICQRPLTKSKTTPTFAARFTACTLASRNRELTNAAAALTRLWSTTVADSGMVTLASTTATATTATSSTIVNPASRTGGCESW